LRQADFAFRLRGEWPRGVAFLMLTLARPAGLRVWPGHFDALSRMLAPIDFLPIALRSPRRSDGTRVRYSVGDDPAARAGTDGRVLLDYDYFNRERSSGTVVAPFMLHPHYYASGLYRRLASFRGRPRPLRLFFAGTADTAAYSRSFAADLFGIMNRDEVLSAVIADFPSEVLVVRRHEDVRNIARSGRPIVLVLTDRTEDNLVKHPLRPREYLGLLAGAAFALCPPGWLYPHCHNLIEALAVGTVPVLGYAHLCNPALTGAENCLTFADRDSLRAAVRSALTLPETEIARLRAAATRCYDSSLCVEAFAGSLALALKAGGDIRVRFPFNAESIRLSRLSR
jgi:hypothetical protein